MHLIAKYIGLSYLTLLAACNCTTRISAENLTLIWRNTPKAEYVTSGQQLAIADECARHIAGAQTFYGVGESMVPLFQPNTAIVVQRVNVSKLKVGMTVLYLKKTGFMVAHPIIERTRKGLLVQGLSNYEPDEELVTDDNIVGVITHAFSPKS